MNALRTALPKAFAKGQDRIIVPAAAYNDAYGTNYSNFYANVADETLNISGTTQSVARVIAELPGFGYTTPPTVNFYGGGVGGGTPGIGGTPGVRATATATLNGVTGYHAYSRRQRLYYGTDSYNYTGSRRYRNRRYRNGNSVGRRRYYCCH